MPVDDALQEAMHEPMTRPKRFALRMAAFTAAVVAGCIALFPTLGDAFFANVWLNSTILGVLVFGICFVFWKTLRLGLEVAWIEAYRTNKGGISNIQPRLLSSMAAMLAEVEEAHQVRLSHAALRSFLDTIGTRLDEQRDLARYWIGLLVFLGLLGTFWGLLGTVGGVADAISGIQVDGDRGAVSVFDDLKAKLEAPLAGMATAFSSSLFGLGGSLVLGFLELQSAQAQNRFYNELEEWLSSRTRLGSGGAMLTEGEQSAPAYIAALLEQTAESVDALRRLMQDGEARRETVDRQLGEFAERLTEFTEQVRAEGQTIENLTETQGQLKDVLVELTAATKGDAETRKQLASLDKHLGKMVEETAKGHKALTDSFRSEIKLLAKTIAARKS